AMRQVIELDPDHAEALNFLAYCFAEQNENLSEALELAERALQLKPEGHVIDTLGWVYFKLGRFEQAREQLEKAARRLPEDAVVRQHLGDVYRALGLTDLARAAYQKALTATPGDAVLRGKLDSLGR
ncbi:MAG: tetratricopeptide repeat protein, partial [Desulfuromonadaceae bacterium]